MPELDNEHWRLVLEVKYRRMKPDKFAYEPCTCKAGGFFQLEPESCRICQG